jgi:hypothetical protein
MFLAGKISLLAWLPLLKTKNPDSLALNRVSHALAEFIMRPQADPQIGASRK